ncbi:MAG: hypothetical protein O3C21_03990 [Verrucomicrobia bacterium]|nr:hypothetical protein [Verrucomicrobiota bacterium]
MWLDEGLAHFIENGALHRGEWFPGIPSGDQVHAVFDALGEDQLPPLTRLFKAGRSEFAEMGRLARGLSVFVIMFLSEGGHIKNFLKSLSTLHDRQNPDEIARLLSESRGKSKDDLQAAFVEFLRSKSDIEAYGNAIRFTAAGRHAEAIKLYREAIEHDPSRGLFLDRLGLSLFLAPGNGAEGESAMVYQKAAAAEPYRGQLTALTIVGNRLFDSGQYNQARQAYQRVLERTLPTPTILHHLAITYAEEDPAQALKIVDDALALPRDGVLYREMFEKLEKLRRELIANVANVNVTGDETK